MQPTCGMRSLKATASSRSCTAATSALKAGMERRSATSAVRGTGARGLASTASAGGGSDPNASTAAAATPAAARAACCSSPAAAGAAPCCRSSACCSSVACGPPPTELCTAQLPRPAACHRACCCPATVEPLPLSRRGMLAARPAIGTPMACRDEKTKKKLVPRCWPPGLRLCTTGHTQRLLLLLHSWRAAAAKRAPAARGGAAVYCLMPLLALLSSRGAAARCPRWEPSGTCENRDRCPRPAGCRRQGGGTFWEPTPGTAGATSDGMGAAVAGATCRRTLLAVLMYAPRIVAWGDRGPSL